MAKRKMTKKTKVTKMPMGMAPGTPEGDRYLNKMDALRRRRGGPGSHGRTIKGQRDTTRTMSKRIRDK